MPEDKKEQAGPQPRESGGGQNASISDVANDDADANPVETSKHPATAWQQGLILLILLLTIPLLYIGGYELKAYQGELNREVQVKWELPKGVTLKPGPTTFRYDREGKTLFYRGTMSDTDKDRLLSLMESGAQAPESKGQPAQNQNGNGNSNKSANANRAKAPAASAETENKAEDDDRQAAKQGYGLAISDLAYLANAGNNALLYLLLVAGIAAAVGAQLRSVSSFIYACRESRLDVVLFWPWYLLRPLIGFVVGVIVVVLVKSGFFLSSDSATKADLWWLGLAIIVGFGAEGFTDKLYQLGKTLFGDGVAETKARKAAADKPAAPAPKAGADKPAAEAEKPGAVKPAAPAGKPGVEPPAAPAGKPGAEQPAAPTAKPGGAPPK